MKNKIEKLKVKLKFYMNVDWFKNFHQNGVSEIQDLIETIECCFKVYDYYENSIKSQDKIYEWFNYENFHNELFNQIKNLLNDLELCYEDWMKVEKKK